MGKEQVVALCDADARWFTEPPQFYSRRGAKAAGETFPKARRLADYRELFDGPDDFDAVVICTPDHHHYAAAIRALRAGKAVFCEKPLTWSTWEAQQLAAETAKRRLPTQMGNQGMGSMGWRLGHAYYHAGAIGEVREVHGWVPPLGGAFGTAGIARPEGSDPVPKTLDWDVWLGPAPPRPFKADTYHPKMWRQWSDFGGGSLADFGCHTLNAAFKVLEPTWPTRVEIAETTEFNGDSFPKQHVVRWTFPASDKRAPFDMYWYDGGLKPPRPKDLEADRKMPGAGCLFIGTKGTMLVTGSHNSSAVLIPDARRKAFGKPKMLAAKSRGHTSEFVQAAKGELPWDAPLSNFVYAGHMTGIIQLGNAALRSSKRVLELDPAAQRVTNLPQSVLSRAARPGWYV
jgi:hypothetical protein